jgi:hypothetical protein
MSDIGAVTVIAGLLGIALATIIYIISRKHPATFTISILSFGIILPYTGLLDTPFYTISNDYFSNYRYRFTLYILCTICAGLLFDFLMQKFRRTPIRGVLVSILLLGLCVASAEYSQKGVNDISAERGHSDKTIAYYREVLAEAESRADGGRLVIDYDRLNYFAEKPGYLFPKPHLLPLIDATSMEELLEQIEAFNIGAFVVLDETWPGDLYGDRIVRTPLLHNYFEAQEHCVKAPAIDGYGTARYSIYEVK